MFKKLAIKIAGRVFRREINTLINDDEFKTKWVGKINEKLDIPKLSEEEEKAHLDALWDVLEDVLKDILDNL